MKTQQENEQIHEMLEHLEKAFKVANPDVVTLIYIEEREHVTMHMQSPRRILAANVHMNSVPAVLRDTVKQLGEWL